MTTAQKQVLNFWEVEGRALAVFEGNLIGPEQIKNDAELAQRYWHQQLLACYTNWLNRTVERCTR